ncbi:hypothetical protein ACFU7Y_17690 [Kitasatospora sp. NPDC057542]|uniref:hypothetical protein n=1 Tax=Streptomycetaceae TaxID=2062 RepID=UPI001CCB19EE|nr:hypothetical protein [Streptomyces sp. LS1784]
MSIFATWLYLADADDGDGPAPRLYQGSHVNPAADHPRGGWLELSAIPNRCHPDVRFGDEPEPEDGWPAPVEYLRLGLGRPAEEGSGEPGSLTTVVLDRTQAELLHATLTRWLNTDRR